MKGIPFFFYFFFFIQLCLAVIRAIIALFQMKPTSFRRLAVAVRHGLCPGLTFVPQLTHTIFCAIGGTLGLREKSLWGPLQIKCWVIRCLWPDMKWMTALLSLLNIDTCLDSYSPFYCLWLLHWNLCQTNSAISAFVHPYFFSLSPLPCSDSFLP